MKEKNKLLLIFSLVLLIAAGVRAGEKKYLNLEQSVTIALENNPEMTIARKELEKTKTAVWEAYSNVLPQLNANANFQHAWEIQKNTMPNFIKSMLGPLATPDMPDYVQIAFGLENTLVYGATVTQPLFLGWAGVAGIQTAQAVQRASEDNVRIKKQDLIYRTSNAFYACMLAEKLMEVQEEALKQAEANLDVVRKKYDAGTASGFDKMRAEVELANIKPEVISARNNFQAALTGLRVTLGLDPATEIKVQGSLAYMEDDLLNASVTDLQNLANENRSELDAVGEQKTIMKKGVTIARSNFLPKLFFQTDYSYMGMRDNLKFVQDDFSKGFTSAISLQLPLFNGFKSTKQYEKARLDYRIAEDTEKQVQNGINAEVEISFNKFHEANEKYLSASETVELATEALRLANLMYEEGASMQLDVINSQLALTRARLNYYSSLYDFQVARYDLRRAIGLLDHVL